MNFKPETSPFNMPELAWRYGYIFALGAMLLVAIGMVIFFRRKKWLWVSIRNMLILPLNPTKNPTLYRSSAIQPLIYSTSTRPYMIVMEGFQMKLVGKKKKEKKQKENARKEKGKEQKGDTKPS